MKTLQYRHIFIFLILHAVQGAQTPINTRETPVVWGTDEAIQQTFSRSTGP